MNASGIRSKFRLLGRRGIAPAPDANSCPREAVLVAFTRGQLRARDRQAIVSHLTACERCYFTVAESLRVPNDPADNAASSRSLMIGLTAIAATLVLTAVVLKWPSYRNGGSILPPVVNAAQNSLHATPGLPDANSPRVTADPISDQLLDLEAAKPAARNLRDQPSQAAITPETIASNLAPGGVAVATRSSASKSPQEQTLIASVHLMRWGKTREIADAVAAFEAAKLATSADPQLVDARYKLASAMEAMSVSLREDARKLWEECLAADATSDRARDVRTYLASGLGAQMSAEQIVRAGTASMYPK
jgi:hypothetical protein